MSDKMSKDLIQSYLNTALRQLEIDIKTSFSIDCEICIVADNNDFGTMNSHVVVGALNSDTMKMVFFYATAFENPPPDQSLFDLEFSGPVELVVQNDTVEFTNGTSFYTWGYPHTLHYVGISMFMASRLSIAKELSYHLK